MKMITCIAPINMAVIKYWGKRDEELILPINDSISASLSTDVMCAKTTIVTSALLKENKFWLNGQEQSFDSPRLTNCLRAIKKRADEKLPHLHWNISICSENNFPTAAGLASSAAGYACLVYALAQLYNIEGEISNIARQGSGSACRSIYGGWVRWHKGNSPVGEDSLAKQIVPADHWPEMRLLVLVVNDTKKKYSSAKGMAITTLTSSLIKYRANEIVPRRIEAMEQAILNKNFQSFAELTMKDSNSMHACCLDSFPPIAYMNEVSHSIIQLVHLYNDYKKELTVAYTVDAGPNTCIYLLESEVEDFLSIVNFVFPNNVDDNEYYRGLKLPSIRPLDESIVKDLNLSANKEGLLKYIIYTKVGEGPRVLDDSKEHLLQDDGLPKHF
ncbi:unnamed protein product [Ceutorhynchus assimilis]|uniref:Diphosphomevalonate decarboxylase n=1 Tax=Ceutorhynchus assimilis TaxID=467358 RepID=A0A9N9QR33_9CUCU|nr:unnamed protein product [Ceutorhynchus assimilis]